MLEISERLDQFFSSYTPSQNKGLRENRVDRMRLLLAHLGSPEKTFRSIHIAGSKGKGTTATVLSRLLGESGRSCGLYLSPHVYDIRERFTLAGAFFPEELYEETRKELEARIKDFFLPEEYGPERPTTFELYTAYAYLLFRKAGCEYAVIETGLGGRLDATNTLSPIATVITSIELEHTQILGNTLTEIAREKSGIMRHGVHTFLLDQEEEVMDLFEKRAKEEEAPLHVFSFSTENLPETAVKTMDTSFDGRSYTLHIESYEDMTILDSFYALYILHKLSLLPEGMSEFHLTKDHGFSMPARFEIKNHSFDGLEETTLVFDGAHTRKSMEAFVSSLRKEAGDELLRKTPLVFSLAEGKDIEAIEKEVLPYFKEVIVTTLGDFKKCNPEEIQKKAKELFPDMRITLMMSPKDALLRAARRSKDSRTIVVTGSFYLCSEIDRGLKEVGYGD